VQGNYFPLNATYDMNSLFCPLANAIASQTEIVRSMGILWSVDHDSAANPKPCVDGRSRQEFAFEFIKGMYNAYPDIPKFAYLNTLAAHDYSIDLGLQPLALEAYDDYLSVFLAEMIARPDAKNTVIVLRSDHGLQGGPSPIDFSTQVEHMNPFNNLIIPSKLNDLSLQRLFYNQDKLVTGYDLYKTLRALVRRPGRSSSSLSKFSYNLLEEKVPPDRTCSDAKIPVSYCPCIEERDDLMPYFYICHTENTADQQNKLVYNPRERKFNAVSFPGKLKEKEEVSLLNLNTNSNPDKSDCQIDSRSEAFVDGDFYPLWNDIDNITSSYPNPKLSGGLFLYPKQVMYFRNLILQKVKDQKVINRRQDNKYTICETGFGAGHSAAFFLSLSPEIQLLSFDKFDRPYQLQALKDLQRKYPGRIHHVQGDSCSTVPSFFQSSNATNWQCDFLHGSSLCPTDNLDLVRYAGGEKAKNCLVSRILTSTAMSSIHDSHVYFGPNAQWRRLRQAGCITDITCFKEAKRSTKGKFIFAKKGMTAMTHFQSNYWILPSLKRKQKL
jgi:hypothetical protein